MQTETKHSFGAKHSLVNDIGLGLGILVLAVTQFFEYYLRNASCQENTCNLTNYSIISAIYLGFALLTFFAFSKVLETNDHSLKLHRKTKVGMATIAILVAAFFLFPIPVSFTSQDYFTCLTGILWRSPSDYFLRIGFHPLTGFHIC